jgi:hypothetical protein
VERDGRFGQRLAVERDSPAHGKARDVGLTAASWGNSNAHSREQEALHGS